MRAGRDIHGPRFPEEKSRIGSPGRPLLNAERAVLAPQRGSAVRKSYLGMRSLGRGAVARCSGRNYQRASAYHCRSHRVIAYQELASLIAARFKVLLFLKVGEMQSCGLKQFARLASDDSELRGSCKIETRAQQIISC